MVQIGQLLLFLYLKENEFHFYYYVIQNATASCKSGHIDFFRKFKKWVGFLLCKDIGTIHSQKIEPYIPGLTDKKVR